MLRKVIEDILDVVPYLLAARPHLLKSWHILIVNLHLLQEHPFRTHPDGMIAVLLTVDDKFLPGFAVLGHTEDSVFLALVMAVAAWGDGSVHGRNLTMADGESDTGDVLDIVPGD